MIQTTLPAPPTLRVPGGPNGKAAPAQVAVSPADTPGSSALAEVRELLGQVKGLTDRLDQRLTTLEQAPTPARDLGPAPTNGRAAQPTTDIAIVVPMSWDYGHKKFSASLEGLQRPEGLQVETIRVNADTIYKMRHEGVQRARKAGAREVLFLDADMAFPKDTLLRLRGHGLSIVGGLCRRRRGPGFEACQWIENDDHTAWRLLPPEGDRPLRVTATGGACLLVQMEVFDAMERRWPGEWYFINKECLPDTLPIAGECMSEDIWFCRRAAEAGYQVWVDQGLKIGHITTAIIYDDDDHNPTVLLEQGVTD